MSKKVDKKWKIIALIIFVLIVSASIIFLFSGENFVLLKDIFNTDSTKEEIQEAIGRLGIRSYIVVCIISALQVIFTFVPAEPLHVISGISFGLWKGIAVCFIGILIGNTIIYILNKVYGDKIKDFFTSDIDFDFNTAKSSTKLALIVIILYCLPAIPYGIICFFAASINMKYPKYILITGIGSIPSLVLDVGIGHIAMTTSWIISIIVFIVILVLLILMIKFKKPIFAKVNSYVRSSKEKEMKRVGKYNPFIYNVIGGGAYSFIKSKIKIKLQNNVKEMEKPCIVLCNHGSFYDFAYAGKLIFKEKPHFVVARMYFHHKILSKILQGTGAIPKSMFAADIDNVKNCLQVISNGEVLAMMPEARLSTVGKFEGIQDATYKFIKKMNVAVYVIKISGDYLAMPKWANKIRKGAFVEAELNQLFKSGECESLSLEEIQDRIDKGLDYNEWEWLEKHPEIEYKNKDLAKGLENILCMCPKCKQISSLTTHKNKIRCSICGLDVVLDKRYQLSGVDFKNISEWYEWQTDELRKSLKSNPNFALESKVTLKHLSKGGKSFTRYAGEGFCKLDRNGLKYIGTQDGKTIEKIFSIDCIYRILFGAGEDFEIYEGQELYYFVPEDTRTCVMWYILSGLLKE